MNSMTTLGVTTNGSMSTLTFNPLAASHAGTYTCRATLDSAMDSASRTISVLLCHNSVPACNIIRSDTKLFPGQTFNITAVAVGQRMGVVPSIVIAKHDDSEGRLGHEQNVQSVDRQCSILTYTIYSEMKHISLNISPQDIGTPNKAYLQLLLIL